MKFFKAMITTACLLTASAAHADSISGTANVVDGSRMVVGGVEITLNAIATPRLGAACLVRSRQMDCGKLARAGLMDITAGATVECRAVSMTSHICTASGYDLSYGQIHAGWAVALPGAPASYSTKMAEARERNRGLWAARGTDSDKPFALLVKH